MENSNTLFKFLFEQEFVKDSEMLACFTGYKLQVTATKRVVIYQNQYRQLWLELKELGTAQFATYQITHKFSSADGSLDEHRLLNQLWEKIQGRQTEFRAIKALEFFKV